MFNGWLRTTYSRFFIIFTVSLLTLYFTGDEEKKKRSSKGAVSYISMVPPHPADNPATVDMDTAEDTSLPHGSPSQTNSPLAPPLNVSDPWCLDSPAAPLPRTGSPTLIDTGRGDTSEDPPQSPSPFLDDISPIPSVPGNTLTQPLLASAGGSALDPTGVHGDFISKDTCAYWESVPGGEKWIEMVKSYLALEAMAPTKAVSIISYDAHL